MLDPGQSSGCTPTPGAFTYNDPNSGSSGTVDVAANTRAVTLDASRTIGIFGDSMTLSGTVSSKVAGEKVTVVAHPVGLPATSTEVTTTAGGNWTLLVQPRVKTTYQAVYDTATSASPGRSCARSCRRARPAATTSPVTRTSSSSNELP